ncbi:hypothetical protein IU470_27395 [Nocardia abscessus]|uniref:Serine protease n=1 Tax=Nocardia abscessus TaxID=120957 RepID=A0ABS0CEP3_9NOCA|nr:hypothetical protein [Nocardia abscessus]MBF6228810.1 hypothetical protein [Nocardia abscessus]
MFTDDAGNAYLGQAAHCATTGQSNDTDGGTSGSLPLRTIVTFSRDGSPFAQGASIGTGQLAYSSWPTVQQRGETDPNACAFNDIALVKITPELAGSVNPSLPHWGGPVGLNTTGTGSGVPPSRAKAQPPRRPATASWWALEVAARICWSSAEVCASSTDELGRASTPTAYMRLPQ